MNQELQTWQVKSTGILRRAFVFYGGFFLVSFFIWKIKELYLFTILIGTLIFFYTTRNILKKKTPLKISIDSKNLTLKYRRQTIELPITEISYSYFGSDKESYQVLTLYKIFTGSRGQTVNKLVQEIISFKETSSWTIQKVDQIKNKLVEIDVPEIKDYKTNFPLWERIMAS